MEGLLWPVKWCSWNRNCHDQLSTRKEVTTLQWPATPCHAKLHKQTTCNIVLNNLIVFQTDKKFPALYLTRRPPLRSQEPDICPYSKSDQSFPRIRTESLKINFNIILPSTTMSFKYSLSYRFPNQYAWTLPLPIFATCPAHLIFLYLIIRFIFGKYRSDRWIILGWISRKWDVGIWTGLGWPRIETGGGRLWVR